MINVKVFCPFERITSIFISKAREAGASELRINFDGFGQRSLVLNENDDRALGFSVADRKRFLRTDVITGKVSFVFPDSVVGREFTVENSMMTDSPVCKSVSVDGKTCVNGELSDSKPIAYPEAVVTTFRDLKIESQIGKPISTAVRPFYQYILLKDDETHYTIMGPSSLLIKKEFHQIGTITHGSRQYSLVSDENNVTDEPVIDVVTQMKDKTVDLHASMNIYLTDGTHSKLFIFGQKNFFFDGVELDYNLVLSILKAASYFETFGCSGPGSEFIHDHDLYVPVQIDTNCVYFSNDFEKFISKYIQSNQVITNLFKQIEATSSSLILYDSNGVPGVLSSSAKNSACFALSFAVMLAAMYGNSVTGFISSLTSCLNNGTLKIVTGSVVGNTSATLQQAKKFTISGKNLNIVRKDYKLPSEITGLNGLCMLGLEKPDWKTRAPGEPDHWIVCEARDGSLTCYFDPYTLQPISIGTNVTPSLDGGESILLTIQGTCDNVALSDLGIAGETV